MSCTKKIGYTQTTDDEWVPYFKSKLTEVVKYFYPNNLNKFELFYSSLAKNDKSFLREINDFFFKYDFNTNHADIYSYFIYGIKDKNIWRIITKSPYSPLDLDSISSITKSTRFAEINIELSKNNFQDLKHCEAILYILQRADHIGYKESGLNFINYLKKNDLAFLKDITNYYNKHPNGVDNSWRLVVSYIAFGKYDKTFWIALKEDLTYTLSNDIPRKFPVIDLEEYVDKNKIDINKFYEINNKYRKTFQ